VIIVLYHIGAHLSLSEKDFHVKVLPENPRERIIKAHVRYNVKALRKTLTLPSMGEHIKV